MKKWMSILIVLILCVFMTGPAVLAQEDDCAAGHHRDILMERVEPLETTDGFERFRCEVCGREVTIVLFATVCNWEPWIIEREPDCTEPGLRRRTCTTAMPHNEYREIPALGHDYEVTVYSSSCQEDGLRIYECARCGDIYTAIYEEASGHTFGAWQEEMPASAGTEGLEARVCSDCGEREERPIAALAIAGRWFDHFNTVDIVAGAASISFAALFAVFLAPLAVTVGKEKAAFKNFLKRQETADREDRKYDFG